MYAFAAVKTEEITFRITFCPDKRLCFLAGKFHPTLLRGWLRDTGYPICYDLLLFATICHYSALFETVRHYSHYSYYSLFAVRYSLFAIRCSLFAVRYSRLFAIRYSGFPDTPSWNTRLCYWSADLWTNAMKGRNFSFNKFYILLDWDCS